MQISGDKVDTCLCYPFSQPPCPPPCPPPSPDKDLVRSKYCQEIGAEMIGNHLIIRLEKDKSKSSRRKRDQWDPPCDCVEIQRPTSKRGPRIINADQDDRIVFRVHSTSRFQKEESDYKSQTIAYKIGPCADEPDSHRCKTITVYPQSGVPGTQEVYSDHITEGGQDIFLLRIKKKAECPDQKDRNVELELRTPKPPAASLPAPAVAPPQPVADLVAEDAEEPAVDTKVVAPKSKSKRAKGKKKRK